MEPLWPPRPEGTLAERVEAARTMHEAGRGNRAIAEALRVTPDTICRYLKAHPCRECGGPIVGAATHCHPCATRRGNPRRWSEREVIAAIRRWVRLEGRAPTSADWRPLRYGGAARWEEEFGTWPPASVGRILFGGWNGLLEAAGVGANKPSWKPEEIRDALRSYVAEFGRPPAKQELEWPPAGYPSSRTVRRHFGSFTAGLRAAGLEPRQRAWSPDTIIDAICAFGREVDRWPQPSDWERSCEDWPCASTVYNRFGNWEAALGLAASARP